MAAATPLFDAIEPTSEFEAAFLRAILEHRGLGAAPSDAEYGSALQLLAAYREQCLDNPREETWALAPKLDSDRSGELAGKAFIMFGTVRPSPAQVQKAYSALFGPLLCETCG